MQQSKRQPDPMNQTMQQHNMQLKDVQLHSMQQTTAQQSMTG